MCFGGPSIPPTPPPPPAPEPITAADIQARIAAEARARNLEEAGRRGLASLRIQPASNSTGLIIPPAN